MVLRVSRGFPRDSPSRCVLTAESMFLRLLSMACLVTFAVTSCSFAPKNIEISVDAPARAEPNQSFVIKAKIRNTGNEPQKLLMIDFPDKFVQGIYIERTEPPYIESKHNAGINTVSYKFNMPLKGGGEQLITIDARAVREGDYSGEVSFVVNKDWCALDYPIRTVVAAPSETATSGVPR